MKQAHNIPQFSLRPCPLLVQTRHPYSVFCKRQCWLPPLVQVREYEGDQETKMCFHNPRNTVAVELFFRGEKMAKVMGSLVSLCLWCFTYFSYTELFKSLFCSRILWAPSKFYDFLVSSMALLNLGFAVSCQSTAEAVIKLSILSSLSSHKFQN